jgi:hypothetical protein
MCNAAVHVQGLSNTAALIYQSEKKKKKRKMDTQSSPAGVFVL